MLKKLILFPFGGNSREALAIIKDINSKEKQWDVLGFIDDNPAMLGKELYGVKVIGDKSKLKDFSDAYVLAVPGTPDIFLKRKEIIDSLQVPKDRFATIIHSSVFVSPDTEIGYNTLVMPNVFISCGVKIGNNCVILPNTTISHESKIGDCCCIGSNVSISGSVEIGSSSYIGSGVKIKNGIKIGERSLVGLGSNVVRDVENEVIVSGNPAKIMRRVGN